MVACGRKGRTLIPKCDLMINNAQTLGPIISLVQDYRGYFEDILASFFYVVIFFKNLSID